MTARTSRGQRILQGKRTKGQSNPSIEFLENQRIALTIWNLFRATSGIIREFWTRKSNGQTGASQFFAYTNKFATDFSDPENPALIPTALTFSAGTMTPTLPSSATANVSDNKVVINWPTTIANDSQAASDFAWYVVVNRTKGLYISGSAGTIRSVGHSADIVATNLQLTAGNTIDVYLFFVADPEAPNAGEVSDCMNITVIATA